MNRDATAQVWEAESGNTIAAIRGPDKIEKHVVFGNGQQLSLAQHPICRRKIPGEDSDFSNIRCRHGDFSLLFAIWK
jgi:hypothetical protein